MPEAPTESALAASSEPVSAAFKPVSRRVATLWNMVFAYGFIALVFARNLLLVPLYLRYIDRDEYGAWLATGGVLGYLMTDFGLLAVLIQQVAVAYGNADRRRLERLVGTGLVIAGVLAVGTSLVGYGASPFITKLFRSLSPNEAANLTRALQISAWGNGSYLLALALIGLLRSLQRPFLSGLLRVTSEAFGLVVTVVMLKDHKLDALAWGFVARSIIAIAGNACWFAYLWLVEFRLHMQWALSDAWALWKLSVYQFMTFLAAGLKWTTDPFLVGVVLGPEANLLYTMTVRGYETVRLLVEQLGTAMLPSLAHLHGEGRRDHYRRIVLGMFRFQFMMAAIGMGGVLAFNQPFVALWVGEQNYAGHSVTALIAIYGLLAITALLPYQVIYSMGQFWQLSKVVWLDLVIRVPLMWVFMKLYGHSWGVVLGAIIGQSIAWQGLLTCLVARELALPRRELAGLGVEMLKITGVMFGAGIFVANGLPRPGSWGALIAMAAAYTVVAGTIGAWLSPILMEFIRHRGRVEKIHAFQAVEREGDAEVKDR